MRGEHTSPKPGMPLDPGDGNVRLRNRLARKSGIRQMPRVKAKRRAARTNGGREGA